MAELELDVNLSLSITSSEEDMVLPATNDEQHGSVNDGSRKESNVEQIELQQSSPEGNFVGRVAGYPVVASTLDKAWNLYSACKESHGLVKYSLESAESGVKHVSATVAPVVTKLDQPLSAVNAVACSGLDIVEKKCPIIQKPTDEVVAETKNMYDSRVKPSVDAVIGVGQYASDSCAGVKDYGVAKVNEVTSYTSEKIGMVRDMSYDKMNMIRDKSYEKLNAALATSTAQTVLDKIDSALTVAESYIDEYLPEKTDEEKPDEPVEVDEAQARSRPVVIYDKAKQRLYCKAMEKLNSVKLRSQETLERFNFTVNLIDYAKVNLSAVNERVASSLQGARDKGIYWWDEIMKDDDTVKDEDCDKDDVVEASNNTLEAQALKVAHNLAMQMRNAIHAVNEKTVPEHLRERYNSAKQYSVELAGSFVKMSKIEDVSDTVMTRAREQAEYIQDTINSVVDVAANNWPLNQVAPDFIIDDLGDTDDEFTDINENDVV